MKSLLLIRHSKSSWNNNLIDFERPISEEGINKSIKMAHKTTIFFDNQSLIWVSASERTVQTAKIFFSIWNVTTDNQVFYKNELYTFDCNILEKIIKTCPNEFDKLILFGHNSAITDFVNKFGDIFIDNVPTSGFVSINFDADDWQNLRKGRTEKIIFPRDI
ncbi:histidine phosphatase family protein [Flavobacterium sp.]|uniref:SixA phosphatase family protein n=1 Tax=Flavobacterium sp. TaxID=239 RepID=UPI002602D3EF|nr:histidine phosphatase family protein [Flavobacterium sp.]